MHNRLTFFSQVISLKIDIAAVTIYVYLPFHLHAHLSHE